MEMQIKLKCVRLKPIGLGRERQKFKQKVYICIPDCNQNLIDNYTENIDGKHTKIIRIWQIIYQNLRPFFASALGYLIENSRRYMK